MSHKSDHHRYTPNATMAHRNPTLSDLISETGAYTQHGNVGQWQSNTMHHTNTMSSWNNHGYHIPPHPSLSYHSPPPNQYSTLSNFDGTTAPSMYASNSNNDQSSSRVIRRSSLSIATAVPPSSYSPSRYDRDTISPPTPTIALHQSPCVEKPPPTKSHTCTQCKQSFTRPHDLKRHAQIHNRTEACSPKCRWCDKPFSRGDALKRHLDNGCDFMPDDEYRRRRAANL